jgi:hypothetical protein
MKGMIGLSGTFNFPSLKTKQNKTKQKKMPAQKNFEKKNEGI